MMGAAPSAQLLDTCAERLARTVGQGDAQHIANAIWALGKLQHYPSTSIMQAMLQADAMQVCCRLCSWYLGKTCIDTNACLQATEVQHHSQVLRGLDAMSFDPGQGTLHAAAAQMVASHRVTAVCPCVWLGAQTATFLICHADCRRSVPRTYKQL